MATVTIRRPNRTEHRFLDAQRVANIVCWYLENRGNEQELKLELSRCLDIGDEEKCQREKQSLAEGLQAMQRAQTTLALADAALAAFEVITRTVERVARFVPQVRPLLAPLRAINATLGTVRGEIRASRAANDAALTSMRLAA